MIFGPTWSIPFVWSIAMTMTKTMCVVVFEVSLLFGFREGKKSRDHLCVFLENWPKTSRWWIYYFLTSLQRCTDKIANLSNLYAKHQKRSKWKEKLCDLTHTLRPTNYDFHLLFVHLHKDHYSVRIGRLKRSHPANGAFFILVPNGYSRSRNELITDSRQLNISILMWSTFFVFVSLHLVLWPIVYCRSICRCKWIIIY